MFQVEQTNQLKTMNETNTPRAIQDGIRIFCAFDRFIDVPEAEKRVHPDNPSKHPPAQLDLLAQVIKVLGWRGGPLVISARSGRLVAGHARLKAAVMLGMVKVPLNIQPFADEAEELKFLEADNRIPELADRDDALIRGLLAKIQTAGQPILDAGYDDAAFKALLTRLTPKTSQDVPAPTEAKELAAKWGTALGQVWELGGHRLICGDSTKEPVVQQLLGDVVPVIMVTDPPYGVEYDPAWREGLDLGKPGGRAIGKVSNDDRFDWTPTYKLFPGPVAYVWHAGIHSGAIARHLEDAGLLIRSQIIWNKQHFVVSRGAYHWKHEPCWYAVRKGATSNWKADRKQTTVWDIANAGAFGGKDDENKTDHGTEKPMECMARPIRHHTEHGDAVYDPFMGSGTTLMAAEQMGRRAFGIDLDPGYIAITLERFAKATGKAPKKVQD